MKLEAFLSFLLVWNFQPIETSFRTECYINKKTTCKFPFVFENETYNGCMAGSGDDDDNYKCVSTTTGKLVSCSDNCPIHGNEKEEEEKYYAACPQDRDKINGIEEISSKDQQIMKVIQGDGKGGFDFPYLVLIYEDGKMDPICEGSLISESFVLTTASCTKGNIYVKPSKSNEQQQTAVSQIIHPLKGNNNGSEDLALIQLSENVKASALVSQICLPGTTTDLPENVRVPELHSEEVQDVALEVVRGLDLTILQNCSFMQSSSKHEICAESQTNQIMNTMTGGPMEALLDDVKYLVGVLTSYQGLRFRSAINILDHLDWIKQSIGSTACNPIEAIIENVEINTEVAKRISTTRVTSQIINPSSVSQQVSYRFYIPESGIVSSLEMSVDKQTFSAKVTEAEAANKIFFEQNGTAALLTATQSFRNEIVLSTRASPFQTINFTLVYDDFLVKNESKYTIHLGVALQQIPLKVQMNILIWDEYKIKVDKIADQDDALQIKMTDDCEPADGGGYLQKISIDVPQERLLNKSSYSGNTFEKFKVNYNLLVPENSASTIDPLTIESGYFSYYFPTYNIWRFPKRIVMVLDVSGSMYGMQLEQTKNAVIHILDGLDKYDQFCIITFSEDATFLGKSSFQAATDDYKNEAQKLVLKLQATGETNIYDGLQKAKNLFESNSQHSVVSVMPMIFFMTDGEATTGIKDRSIIVNSMKSLLHLKIPIYGIAYGVEADFNLVESIALSTGGTAIRVTSIDNSYLDFENFYYNITSPILKNVKLSFNCEAAFSNITIGMTDTFYENRDNFIVGRQTNRTIELKITGTSARGFYKETVRIPPLQTNPGQIKCKNPGKTERLWAYLLVKQYNGYESDFYELEDKVCNLPKLSAGDTRTLASELALKHGFITNATSALITLDPAYKKPALQNYFPLARYELTSFNQPTTDFIKFYEKTYLRGSTIKIDESTSDLKGFGRRASSFSIDGSACWILYELPNFKGESQRYKSGKYPSAIQLGSFFKNIGSIEKSSQC